MWFDWPFKLDCEQTQAIKYTRRTTYCETNDSSLQTTHARFNNALLLIHGHNMFFTELLLRHTESVLQSLWLHTFYTLGCTVSSASTLKQQILEFVVLAQSTVIFCSLSEKSSELWNCGGGVLGPLHNVIWVWHDFYFLTLCPSSKWHFLQVLW